jgi:arylsulfatase A
MKCLDELNLAEKTLIILCSDNGPVLDDGYKDQAVEKLGNHNPSGPFRGGKYSVFEGGTRTPFVTRWKGRIQPGVSNQIVCTVDFPASFAALTGVKLPADSCLDSVNVMPALLGEKDAKGRESLLQQDNRGTSFGLREGNWKLIRNAEKNKVSHQLYDLSKDPSEKTNVAAQFPEERKRLIALLDQIIAK